MSQIYEAFILYSPTPAFRNTPTVKLNVNLLKGWYNMHTTSFYVISRDYKTISAATSIAEKIPPNHNDIGAPLQASFKEHTVSIPNNGSSIYREELSIDFTLAQSILHCVYGRKIQETGHRTEGHLCVSDFEREVAAESSSSLLYGELLPRGVNRALDHEHLDGAGSSGAEV